MASKKRERSAGDTTGQEDPTRRKFLHLADTMDQFTIQVALRSKLKAEQNDHRPVKTWKQYCEDLGKARREAEEKETISSDLVAAEETESDRRNETKQAVQFDFACDDASSVEEDGDNLSDSDEECDQESDEDTFAEFPWLEQIDGTIQMPNQANLKKSSRVGYCDAKLIRRNRMRSFYSDLEQPSQETSNLAFELFDRYGRLKKEFKEHIIKKGSGIWGDEFNSGDLLLLEYVFVEEPYRHQGLGRKLITAILDKVRSKSYNFFAVVAPGWLNHIVSAETKDADEVEVREVQLRHQAISEKFFRSLGFRRVGSSSWLALASNPKHPAHTLDMAADFDLPTPPPRTVPTEICGLFEDCQKMEDEALVSRFQEILGDRSCDDPVWLTVNESGNTVLHHAAATSKPRTIAWILKKSPDNIQQLRNDNGETALDTIETMNEEYRTKRKRGMLTLSISDQFTGFSDDTVACLARLKGLSSVSYIQLLRLKFGCTCGKCIGGFLSPRMRFALRQKAGYIHDAMNETIIDDIGIGEDFDFFDSHAEYLKYVPPSVLNNMMTNKSMRQGFASLFDHFVTLSQDETPQGLLSEVNIYHHFKTINEWPPHTRNYLSRGGTIHAVGSCLFEVTMNEDEIAGDGDPMMVILDDEEKAKVGDCGLSSELASLPECRNDLEYGFVSAQLGYELVSREF